MLLSLAYLVLRTLLRLVVPKGQARPPWISRSSCSGTSLMSFGDRLSGLVFDLPIEHFWPPRPNDCRGLVGSVSS
jgi:hypothetical protein